MAMGMLQKSDLMRAILLRVAEKRTSIETDFLETLF